MQTSNSARGLDPRQAILGAKVYKPVRDPKTLVEFAVSLGLNWVFVGDELATWGRFREQVRKAGLKYALIIRMFNDPETARADPSLVSTDRQGRPARRADDVMICPSRADFRRAKLARMKALIERREPDAVTLDYFRFFIYWEGVDPQTPQSGVNFPAFCFDRACLEDFLCSTHLSIPLASGPEPSAAHRDLVDRIWKEHREAWYEWRVHRLVENAWEFTGMIRKSFPGLAIVLHAVPWTREEFGGARQTVVGQDLRRLAPFFDYVSPMAYSALTRRGPGWVERLSRALLAEFPSAKLLPSIEVGPDGPQFPAMSAAHYESDLEAVRRAEAGVVLYHLELLLDAPVKQAITKRLMQR
jgi:hypothetical protein